MSIQVYEGDGFPYKPHLANKQLFTIIQSNQRDLIQGFSWRKTYESLKSKANPTIAVGTLDEGTRIFLKEGHRYWDIVQEHQRLIDGYRMLAKTPVEPKYPIGGRNLIKTWKSLQRRYLNILEALEQLS